LLSYAQIGISVLAITATCCRPDPVHHWKHKFGGYLSFSDHVFDVRQIPTDRCV